MKERTWRTIGLMSGTSLDGIDLCHCIFHLKQNAWSYEITVAETLPYPPEWEKILSYNPNLCATELLKLDHDYGNHLSAAVNEFLQRHQIAPGEVDLLASHGHTLFHRPEQGFTFQLGNGPELFVHTGIKTICDFRRADVAMDGQGAPLVPIGDELLFGNYDGCLNLGGFANISHTKSGRRIASDICPLNFVLNHFAKKLNRPYDEGGKIAASAEVDDKLFATLNELPFYTDKGPKSLGAEWIHESIFPLLRKSNLTPESILATFTAHAASQIGRTLQENQLRNCIVTGGGAFNHFLIKSIRTKCNTELKLPRPEIINYKEALIFAFMGVLKDHGEVNVLSSVTGSSKDHSSGIVYC